MGKIGKISAPMVLGVLALALVCALGAIVVFTNRGDEDAIRLPLLTIGGVVVLVFALSIVAAIFAFLGLADRAQAMALPDGSIRAVIALSLVLLFAILSVFLYEGVSTGSENVLNHISEPDRDLFLKSHPNILNVQAVLAPSPPPAPPPNVKAPANSGAPGNGGPPGNAGPQAPTPPVNYYNLRYYTSNPTADDFAKQLVVLLGAIMTSITSFYLGAKTATSSAAAAVAAQNPAPVTPPPSLVGIAPTTFSTADGQVLSLRAMGANLNNVVHARLERGASQIAATKVTSNPTEAACEFPVTAQTAPPGPPWTVVVIDSSGATASTGGLIIS